MYCLKNKLINYWVPFSMTTHEIPINGTLIHLLLPSDFGVFLTTSEYLVRMDIGIDKLNMKKLLQGKMYHIMENPT